jgi:general secretion pathway protein A
MYIEHFGLTAEPFSLTPDPAFLYLSPQHREALAAVQYGLLDGRGFITLIGEVGTGKTTLLYSILGQRHRQLDAAYVSFSSQSFEDLLAMALRDLGLTVPADASKRMMLDILNDYLVKRGDEGRTAALIIDEAQNLSDAAFEDLRLLSNFETYTRKLLQIVLVGQPELQERLRQPGLRQLRERVSVRAYINPMTREETAKYVAHRLERAGGSAECFSPRALRAIVGQTAGIPRRANILCHNALLFTYGRNLPQVRIEEAREAIAEMRERRPGRIPRDALRRAHWSLGRWRWGAALCGAVAIGLVAGRMTAEHVDTPAVTTRTGGDVAAVAPAASRPAVAGLGEAVAALKEPAAAVAMPDETAAVSAAAPAVAEVPDAVAAHEPEPAAARPTAVHDARVAAVPEPAPAAPAVGARTFAPSEDEAPPGTRAIVVPRGATLWNLVRDANGGQGSGAELLARAQRLNPQLKDVNVIIAGDRLLLPVPSGDGRAPEGAR